MAIKDLQLKLEEVRLGGEGEEAAKACVKTLIPMAVGPGRGGRSFAYLWLKRGLQVVALSPGLCPARCLILCLASHLAPLPLAAADSWQAALSQMPLGTNVTQLNRTNCVDLMLRAFQSNHVVKTLIFMPGATDEFYMFHRAKADLAGGSASLLDAVNALTNQTLIRATFHPPFLLLHTDEDPLEPLITIQHQGIAARFKQTRFVPHVIYNDRDWDVVQPMLKGSLKADIRPWRRSYDSWHFYRHSFAAWDLTGWEALEAVALAGKTSVTIRRNQDSILPRAQVVFEGDTRVRATPRLDALPR